MYSAKDRLLKVLNKKSVDRPPCICPGGMMNMVVEEIMDITNVKWPQAHFNSKDMAKLTYGIYKEGALENCGVPFCMTVEAEAMGATVDFGTKTTEPRVSKYPISKIDDYKKLSDIDLNKSRPKIVLEAIKELKRMDENVPVIGNIVGPISVATSLIEPADFYKQMRKDKQSCHEFLEYITYNLIVFAKAQIEAGADVITISDPSATGEILGPKLFDEFVVPYINKILNAINKEHNIPTIVHICGRLKTIYPQLNKFNSLAISFDSITDVKQVIENVHNKAIMGNVSTYTLEYGTEEKVKAISKMCINNGVDILSPACGVGVRTSLANLKSMVNSAKESALLSSIGE